MALRWREQRMPDAIIATTWPSRLWALPMLAFFAFWWRATLPFVALVFAHGRPSAPLALFVIAFPASGLVLLWFGLRLLVNRTQLHIDALRLVVREGPLPGGARAEVAVADIERVDVESFGDAEGPRGHRVVLVLSGDRRLPLVLPATLPGDVRAAADRIGRALDDVRAPRTYRG